MAQQFSAEWAKGMIEEGAQKAQGLINDPEQINGLLEQLQEKLQGLPSTVGNAFRNVPVMAQMVKSYVTREYTDVSPKVVISLVSAIIYLVKRNDIIPDNIPIVGYADDIAVATIAMVICEPELKAFAAWREQQSGEPVELAPIEYAEAAETIAGSEDDEVLADTEGIDASETTEGAEVAELSEENAPAESSSNA